MATSLLSSLLRRNRAYSRQVAKPAPRARLRVEGLEAREVPSVTSALADGVLTVTGDGADDSAEVSCKYGYRLGNVRFGDTSILTVTDRTTGRVQEFYTPSINKVVMNGGGGNDRLVQAAPVPTTFDGGDGVDTLTGGGANDIFLGSAGPDVYTGGGGQDVLYRRGNRGYFADGNAADHDLTVGLAAGRLSPAELRAAGDLTVSLDGRRLTFNGPSGAGFVMESDWRKSGGGFTTPAAVTLKTTAGDVDLGAWRAWPGAPSYSRGATVTTAASPVADAGTFGGMAWDPRPFANPTNPLDAVLARTVGPAGLSLGLTGVDWGVGLGGTVKGLDAAAPLNDAVPYLYLHLTGGFSLGYANAVVGHQDGRTGTVAYAPGDGTVYAGVTGLPVVGDLGVAVSPNGYIPYTPRTITGGPGDPNISGHFYVRGAVALADGASPVSVRGETVLDLDANKDGKLAGLDAATIARAVHAFQSTLTSPEAMAADGLRVGGAVLGDVAVGFNGAVDLPVKAMTLSLDAEFWYKPGEAAFRAKSNSPFARTPILKDFGPGAEFEVEGRYVRGSNGSTYWSFRAAAQSATLFGFSGAGLLVEAGSSIAGGAGLHVGASLTGLAGFAAVRVDGTVSFTSGDFSLTGRVEFERKIEPVPTVGGGIDGSVTITLARTGGSFRAAGHIYGHVHADATKLLQFSADASAGFAITVGSDGRAHFSGQGSFRGQVKVVGVSKGKTIGFKVSDSVLSLDIPSFYDLDFKL